MGQKASQLSDDEKLRELKNIVTGNNLVAPKCVTAQLFVNYFCAMNLLTKDVAGLIMLYFFLSLSRENRKNVRFQSKAIKFPMSSLCRSPNAIIADLGRIPARNWNMDKVNAEFRLHDTRANLVYMYISTQELRGLVMIGSVVLNCVSLFNAIAPKNDRARVIDSTNTNGSNSGEWDDDHVYLCRTGKGKELIKLRTKATLLFLYEHVYVPSRMK